MSERKPSFRQQVMDLLNDSGRAMTVDEMAEKLLPDLSRKRAHGKIRSALGTDNDLAVRVGRGRYDLLLRRLIGARIRYRPSVSEVNHGVLNVSHDLSLVFSSFDDSKKKFTEMDLIVTDEEGNEIPVRTSNPGGPRPPHLKEEFFPDLRYVFYRLLLGIDVFFEDNDFTLGDELVIEIVDLAPPHYRMTVEKEGERDEEQIRAADAQLVETCYNILKYVREETPDDLMRKLAGLHDFSRGVAPHLPMYVLPRDSRFLYFFPSYYLLEHPRAAQIPFYEKDAEQEEMEALLQGASAFQRDIDDHIERMKNNVKEMFPSGLPVDGLVSDVVEQLVRGQPEKLRSAAELHQILREVCFDRMRIMRGLWPGDPEPTDVQQWLKFVEEQS